MEKFSQRITEKNVQSPKYSDKIKQEIYSLIKENFSSDGEKMSQLNDEDTEEITDKLYNFVQKEKLKEEIATLESINTILVAGPFNYRVLNEQIEQLRKKLKSL
jgi:hypothetical protein